MTQCLTALSRQGRSMETIEDMAGLIKPSVAADWHWLGQQLEDLKNLCDSGDVLAARAALMELAWGKTLPPVPSSGEAPVPGRFADRQ